MSLLFDILHLTIAAVLAVIGVGYEREQDCPPVRFEPAAQVSYLDERDAPKMQPAALDVAAHCDGDSRSIQFPVL